MHPRRPNITGQLARYGAAILISVGIHWRFFRAPKNHQQRAKIELQQGQRAVELNLLPSVASKATKPKPKPITPPTPKPEPIKEIIEKEAEINFPVPQPEPEPESETKPEPETQNSEPETLAPESVEQIGAQESKGVSAQATSTIRANYPRRSCAKGEEGSVELELHITATGKLTQAIIKKSSGFRRLDEAALKAVRKATYSPAIKDGQPAADVILQTLTFKLTD